MLADAVTSWEPRSSALLRIAVASSSAARTVALSTVVLCREAADRPSTMSEIWQPYSPESLGSSRALCTICSPLGGKTSSSHAWRRLGLCLYRFVSICGVLCICLVLILSAGLQLAPSSELVSGLVGLSKAFG